jgi:DNA-directed RNA polymerase specialized sigma24 family protein
MAHAISMKDMGIVAALRGGNLRRALELLFDTYQEELYAYCASLVGPSEALTVYNRVLGAAVDGLTTVPKSITLRAWLYRLARHAVTHQHQQQRRSGALEDDYAPVDGPDALVGAGPSQQLQLHALPPEVREILQLGLWQGLRLRDVAQILERPLPEVRRLAAQGLVRLAAERHVASSEVLPS